jgi:hypothetical protein
MNLSWLVSLRRLLSEYRRHVVPAAFLFSLLPCAAMAQGGGYLVPNSFWIQEPIATLTSGHDNPENNGSPSPAVQYIRMNGTTWNTILPGSTAPTQLSDYQFASTIDKYKAAFQTGKPTPAVLMYTWYRTPPFTQGSTKDVTKPPSDWNSTGNCYYPLTGTANDCSVKSFWTAFMAHVCPSYQGQPVSDCWVQVFELWNEYNTEQFWTGSAQQLAKMGTDAATIIRQYCSNCVISMGSTTAGGAGGGADASLNDPRFPTGVHLSSYDYAQSALISQWQSYGAKPDFISWHPYSTWTSTSYQETGHNSGNSYQVAVEPEPFPETASSGDGQGLDYGDNTGSHQHTGSVICANISNEYSVAFTDNNGQHYGTCSDAIAGTGPSDTNSQIYKLTQIAKSYKVTVDGTTTGNPVLWATEGGFSAGYNMQGTDDQIPETTSGTRRNFLRRSYMGRYLISMAGRGVSAAIGYSYDINNNNCYMPQYGPAPGDFSTSTSITCAFPSGHTFLVPYNSDYSDTNYVKSGYPYSGQLLGLTAIGQAYNTAYAWMHGNEVYCNNEDTTHVLYNCDVYNSSKTYIGTIFWNYSWNSLTTNYTLTSKGAPITCKWYIDSTTPLHYPGGTISVSGEPVFYYADTVSGAPSSSCP